MISIIRIDESEKWDSVIKSFKNYDVYYLSGYVKAFQIHGDGDPLLFYYEDGYCRAINVVMKRDISKTSFFKEKLPENEYFDITTPYGYGGFLIDGDSHDIVISSWDEYCLEQGFVSEFVRFHLLYDSHKFYSGEILCNSHNVSRSLDISMDDMFYDFEHKIRKNVKRAIASDVSIIIDENAKHIEDFLVIYYNTMKRSDSSDYFFFSKAFFNTLSNMKNNTIFFHALYDNKIISTELVLYGSQNCYSFLGGTNSDYFQFRPNEFLKYEIIKWAKAKGLKRFILGGGYGDDDGIFKYKKSFAPKGIVEFHIGKRIIDQEKYNYLVTLRAEEKFFDLESSFFPLYRV